MDFSYYILSPFSLLLTWFYKFFNNYGLALVLFALVVKLILFPFSLKGKRSMIQMNLLSGKLSKLQKQYANNQQKYNEEVQKLYEKEGVNPMGGCLWSLIPLFILIPLYAIIRQPLKYLMGMTAEQITAVAQALNWSAVALENGWIKEAAEFVNGGYNQLYLSSLITPENLEAVKAAAGATAKAIFPINFGFLGVNLARIPQLKFWVNGLMGFGLFVIPVISAATSVLFSLVSTRTNQMNNPNGADEQTQKTNRTMMLISPLMSLWIGFSMPAALSIYWIANNILGLLQEVISGRMLKKDYEQAAEAARQRAIEEKEEEKRQRREKAERRAREAEEARKNKGKKKKAEADDEDKMTPEQREASREGIRRYARGRAYDPGRYGGVTPYTDPVHFLQATDLPGRKKDGKKAQEDKKPQDGKEPPAEAAQAPEADTPVETPEALEPEAPVEAPEAPAAETPVETPETEEAEPQAPDEAPQDGR